MHTRTVIFLTLLVLSEYYLLPPRSDKVLERRRPRFRHSLCSQLRLESTAMEGGMRSFTGALVVVTAVFVLPSLVFAQATIAGVVRDSSGAILPGVTVEASSPALTEKVRTVVTDGTGQYRIVTLPP